jgi:hypothetical protein
MIKIGDQSGWRKECRLGRLSTGFLPVLQEAQEAPPTGQTAPDFHRPNVHFVTCQPNRLEIRLLPGDTITNSFFFKKYFLWKSVLFVIYYYKPSLLW